MLFVTTPGKNICYIALVRITSGYQWPVGGIIIDINTKYQGQLVICSYKGDKRGRASNWL
jgi:hypothetical protein